MLTNQGYTVGQRSWENSLIILADFFHVCLAKLSDTLSPHEKVLPWESLCLVKTLKRKYSPGWSSLGDE